MEQHDPASETARVLAAQAGDTAARARLFEDYLPLVQAIASRALDGQGGTCHGHTDAEDVVQETMVRAVAHLSELRDPDRFRPWLVAITVRQLRERGRRARRRGPELSLDSLQDSLSPGSLTGSLPGSLTGQDVADQVATELDGAAQRAVVERALDWLEPEEREVFALWQLELEGSITRDDLAAGLDVSRTHAAVRVHRMKLRLQETRRLVTALLAPCADLRRVTRGWDGEPGSVWRKRLHRHVRGCPACGAASSSALPVHGGAADRSLARPAS